jgi:exosortase
VRPALVAAGLLLFLLLPLLLVVEANPEWRRTMWIHGGITVGVTLLILAAHGGRAWAGHFAFPVCFSLVAIPWPSGPEQLLIQGLARQVAQAVATLLPWLGIPALVRGNLIEVGTGLVGVEEACSGIRSLQSTLMLALFFGEYYRLGTARRMVLLCLGCGAAVLGNLGRTLVLTLQAAQGGATAVGGWHDIIGYIASGLGFGAVWLLAWWLTRANRNRPSDPTASQPDPRAPSQPTRLPQGLPWIGVAWLATCLLGVETWYRFHERNLIPRPAWHLEWPANRRPVDIGEKATWMLRFDEHETGAWTDPKGRSWVAYCFRWHPGRAAVHLAGGHTPAICFTGSGMRLVEDLGTQTLSVHGLEFEFEQYLFETGNGKPLHAFWCLQEDKVSPAATDKALPLTVPVRLASVRTGQRNLGQQVLEIAMATPETPEDARGALQAFLDQSVRPGPATPQPGPVTK